mgnify:CR=1 FL=1
MIPHRYIDANDDPAAFAADRKGRQAATAAWTAGHIPASTRVWSYDPAAAAGEDPWTPVWVHAQDTAGCMLVDAGGTATRVAGDTRVFIDRNDLPQGVIPPAGRPVILDRTRTLIEMDRPLLVTAKDAEGFNYLAVVNTDAPDGGDIFMAARVARKHLDALEANRMPLRDMFTRNRHGALLYGQFTDEIRGVFVHRDEPDDHELPEPGIKLERE